MKYLVLMKHVPKFTKVHLDPKTHNLVREGMKMEINEADLNAITLALQLKRQTSGEIIVLTMGPESSKEMIREAIAMGADRGYVLCSKIFRASDTLATSYALTEAIKYIGDFDVIICGTQTVDGDTGQVGPQIAERLGINQATYVKDVNYKDRKFEVIRQLNQSVEKQRVTTPILFSTFRGSNLVKRVSKEKIESIDDSKITLLSEVDINIDTDKVGEKGSATVVKEVFALKERTTGVFVNGNSKEQVDKLVEILIAERILNR